MAEGFVCGIAQTFITELCSNGFQKILSAWGVEEEVTRLKSTLTAIKQRAKKLQLSGDDDDKTWLSRFKDAVYDAEDLTDDFEALRNQLVMQGSFLERVRHLASSSNPILLRFNIAHRIIQVRETLQEIQREVDTRVKENHGFISEGRQTHSYIPEGKVVGRDAEREKIVNLLLLDSSGRNNLSVIPIQGMGGIGKTALAQLVYNDERVVDSFGKDRMMWICVSDEFDLQKIIEKIIGSRKNKECSNLEELQIALREHLGGKRYLLVLDDVWNEDFDKWEELRDLLIVGASGSRIIVTTRSEKVGRIMGTTNLYQLSKLSEDDCWNVFKSRAFKEGQDANPELVDIGKDIAKKCVGVPLAAKTLGGLCYEATKQTWEFVRESDVWRLSEEKNGILRALRIGYNHLPFYLQQCFAYCSLFPKDYKIEKDMLIKLWIAQGFIHSFGESRSLEDIGSEYVEVLMWRSFFQEPEKDDYDNLIQFKMHDLVHDLAQSVAGVECFTICENKEESYPEGVRHLFIEPYSLVKTLGIIPNIRTFISAFNNNFFFGSIISSLKFLRVLVFRNDDIEHLPNSIDKLKHLRYLELECHKIKNLPESITNLQNLQVLKLKCEELEELSMRIQNMVSLRHIDLGGKFQFYNTKLSHMPSGLKELKSLETLSHFVVGTDGVGCALNGLKGLSNLGGALNILNLENVKNAEECGERNLKDKKKLLELGLVWEPFEEADIKERERRIDFKALESLETSSNLKILGIEGYAGIKFPRWMMDSSAASLRNVVEIVMEECHQCEQLFPLSLLPSLKTLTLGMMRNLEYIEEDRPDVQSGKECFSSLTELEIRDCPNLESWFPAVEAQSQQSLVISFPCLVELSIWYCPKLKSVPHLVPSCVKKLDLNETTGEVVESLVGVSNPTNSSSLFPSLEWLVIISCWGMESWPNWLVGSHLPSLRKLEIGCTPTLPFLPQQIQHLPALQDLSIFNYSEEALPEWMANITSSSLGRLSLYFCPNLKILPEWVLRDNTTVENLRTHGCPHLFDRYNEETGEDRHTIAHIRDTYINTERLQESIMQMARQFK